jgi:hypothetical protein
MNSSERRMTKMGEKVKAMYEFGFELPDEGYYVLGVGEIEIAPADNGGLSYKLTDVIDGGAFDGQKHWDNFGTRQKKHFGIRKMLGFLEKAGVLEMGSDLDTDEVETAEFQKMFMRKVKGVKFGAYLSHRDWEAKDGTKKTSTNIDKYMTVDEVKAKWRDLEKGTGTVNQKADPVAEVTAPATAKKASVWK